MTTGINQTARIWAIALTIASGAAMLYVGLYQSRHIRHLWCPIYGKGCEAVADAVFARPFGIPDGYIAAVLYAVILLLLYAPIQRFGVWTALVVLTVLATIVNVLGVKDMQHLGAYCFYCVLTTVASPVLLVAVWMIRRKI